jgi:phage baseplate assembly protein W
MARNVASPLTRSGVIYSDINTNFSGGRGSLGILVTNIDAINNQIYNLLSTYSGEADYEPTLWGGLDRYLFEQNSDTTMHQIYITLYNVLVKWMSSRIYVTPNSFTATMDSKSQIVRLTVNYTYLLINANVKTQMNIPINGATT